MAGTKVLRPTVSTHGGGWDMVSRSRAGGIGDMTGAPVVPIRTKPLYPTAVDADASHCSSSPSGLRRDSVGGGSIGGVVADTHQAASVQQQQHARLTRSVLGARSARSAASRPNRTFTGSGAPVQSGRGVEGSVGGGTAGGGYAGPKGLSEHGRNPSNQTANAGCRPTGLRLPSAEDGYRFSARGRGGPLRTYPPPGAGYEMPETIPFPPVTGRPGAWQLPHTEPQTGGGRYGRLLDGEEYVNAARSRNRAIAALDDDLGPTRVRMPKAAAAAHPGSGGMTTSSTLRQRQGGVLDDDGSYVSRAGGVVARSSTCRSDSETYRRLKASYTPKACSRDWWNTVFCCCS
eukprot:GHVU01189476.1.p1 GENE.GHVU01189476.1~~GHVU01189476.1.p1  ORF type:complete len:346 (-),score=16.04 GHVU01189476.1:457-1494(-)